MQLEIILSDGLGFEFHAFPLILGVILCIYREFIVILCIYLPEADSFGGFWTWKIPYIALHPCLKQSKGSKVIKERWLIGYAM